MKTNFGSLSALALAVSAACGGKGGGHGPTVLAPSDLAYGNSPAIQVVDLEFPSSAPSVVGAVDRYSVQPPLPSGLALDPVSGLIGGAPGVVVSRGTYAITASNAGGSTTFAFDLTVVAAPRFAYCISGEDSSITVFAIDAGTGRLIRRGYQSPRPGELGAEHIYVHPSEAFAYVPNRDSQNISVYAVDSAQGWLVPRDPVDAGPGPHTWRSDRMGASRT